MSCANHTSNHPHTSQRLDFSKCSLSLPFFFHCPFVHPSPHFIHYPFALLGGPALGALTPAVRLAAAERRIRRRRRRRRNLRLVVFCLRNSKVKLNLATERGDVELRPLSLARTTLCSLPNPLHVSLSRNTYPCCSVSSVVDRFCFRQVN